MNQPAPIIVVPQMPHPHSCIRLDGSQKVVYASRSEAARNCPKHMTYYRCRACGTWHRATNRRKDAERDAWPMHAAWLRKAA
jgi:hypothetical protein